MTPRIGLVSLATINRDITKGCTRSTHSGGCEVGSFSFVPGDRCRYHAQKEFKILMERFYPAETYRLSRNRLLLLASIMFAILLWFLYAWVSGSTWKIRLVSLFACSSFAAFSVAQSFWPILSFDEHIIYDHSPLWFPKKYLISDIKDIELTESNLYLTHKSDAVSAIDLNRISPENMLKIEQIIAGHRAA